MEFITETRGGWDEYSDSYQAVLGIEFETGERIESRVIEDFTDSDGCRVVIELPMRTHGEITIELYGDEGYAFGEVSRSDFESVIDSTDRVVRVSELDDFH